MHEWSILKSITHIPNITHQDELLH